MDESLATALLVIAAAALVWLAVRHVAYRATHPYSRDDLAEARRDATRRSRSALGGTAGEQLAPLVPAFTDRFDATDARFLGAPVDYVVFDGLCAGDLRELVVVEVKTGRSQLNANERQVELAVHEGRVRFEVLRL